MGKLTLGLRTTRQVFALLAVAALLACAWLRPLDAGSERVIDAGLKRALVSFATARALNAAISVAQGTEVSVQPAGVGVNFAPGQVLDPVNDVVERFSNLMLAASVAFGVQKVLVQIGGYWIVSLLLSAAALAWLALAWSKGAAPAWLGRGLLFLLLLRFAVPLATVGSDLVFETFLANDYRQSQQAIEGATDEMQGLNPPASAAARDDGWLERWKGWWSQNLDLEARLDKLKALAEAWTDHIVTLMVVFVLQTLLLPLLLLWALVVAARSGLPGPLQREA